MQNFERSNIELKNRIKELEHQLKKSEARYTQVETEKKDADAKLRTLSAGIEQSPVTTVITDASGNIQYVNPKFTEITGYSAEEVIGKNSKILKPDQKLSWEYKELWETIHSGKNWKGEFENKKKNGELYWESAIISPVKDEKGVITNFLAVKEDITARRKIEEALRKSEELYHSLFDNMLNGFAFCKMIFENGKPQDYICIKVNSAFSSLTGLNNVVGKKVSEVIPGINESDSELLEIFGRVASTGKPETIEIYVEALKMWFSISVYSPEKEYFVAIFDVITKRKNAEEALRESEERFSIMFQAAPVGLALAHYPDGIFHNVNQAWLNIVGCSRKEEAIGKTALELGLIPEQVQRDKILNEFRKNGIVRNAEISLSLKSGEKRIILTNVDMIDINGRKFMLSTNEDITERKKVDSLLKNLMVGIEQSPVITIITDAFGNIQYVNPKFTEITGYRPDEAIGRNPRMLKTQNKSNSEYKELWQTLLSGQNWQGVFHNKKKNGELYWESAVISPIKDVDGIITHFLAVKEDITAHKLTDEQRKKDEQTLKENEIRLHDLNSTKDKFFSIIAHDLKNPFAVIKSSSELLAKYLEKNDLPKSKAKAAMISNASNHGYALLENLLVWAKSQTGGIKFDPQKLNFKNRVDNNITEVEDHASEKNIVIINDIPDDLILEADEHLLSVVFRNLITNAIKFTNGGGTITITAKLDNNIVEVAVIDTGIGIPKEHQYKLFRLDTHFSRPGTANEASSSLGLLLCKEFVEKHKGKIWVESEANRGSEFRFTLPHIQSESNHLQVS